MEGGKRGRRGGVPGMAEDSERLTGGTERQRGPVGSGWVREGVRGSRGSAARCADWQARQHTAGRLGFKPDSNRIKLFKMVQTDSKLSKLWLTQNGAFLCSKNCK
jgi:hypothetical protein